VTPETWTRLKKIFDQAVELDECDRQELLDRLDREDPAAGKHIRKLLSEFDSESDVVVPLALEGLVLGMGLRAPERIGSYRVVRELGRGGTGIVFLAIRESSSSHEAVALKLLPWSGWDPAGERRFTTEKRVLEQLKHPCIARFIDWGLAPGALPYLVLEYVDGQPLDLYCASNALDLRERLELFLHVLDAVACAHRNAVIHRDLKPGNILVTPHRQVKLLDFGISKLLDPATDITTTLERRFTPAYASPEQIRGAPTGPGSDIYALGVILYEIVTGTRPYGARVATVEHLSRAVLEETPPTPSSAPDADRALASHITPALDRIVLRALAKEARDRYSTVDAFAEDIRHYLNQEPLSDALRRPRRLVLLAAAVCVMLAAGSFALWLMKRARPHTVRLSPAVVLSGDAALSAYPSLSATGKLIYASGRGADGVLHIWMQDVAGGPPVQLTHGDRNDIAPDISSDGKWIAFQSEREPKGIYLAPAKAPIAPGVEELIAPFGLNPRFSPDGKWLTFWTKSPVSEFGSAWKIPVDQSREPYRIARGFEDAHNPAWMPDGRTLVICGTRRSNGGPSEEHDFWIVDRDTDMVYKTGVFSALARLKIVPHQSYMAATFQALPEGVLFVGDQSGAPSLWLAPLHHDSHTLSGDPYRIDYNPGSETHPAIAGDRIAFVASQARLGIWTLPLDAESAKVNGDLARVTSAGDFDLMPSVSRDGRTILFLRREGAGMRLYQVGEAEHSGQPLTDGTLDVSRVKVPREGRYGFYRLLEPDPQAGDIKRQAIYRIDLATGITSRVCANCGGPTSASSDDRFLLFETGSAIGKIAVLRLGKEERWDLLRHSHHAVASARFSPDGHSVVFELDQGLDGRQILTAPFREDGLSENWVAITPEHGNAFEPWWSPEGHWIYYLDEKDGFRCIWARRWNNSSKKPEGEPVPIYHFHDSRIGPLTLVNRTSRYIGLSVARDRLVLALSELLGEIRMATLEK